MESQARKFGLEIKTGWIEKIRFEDKEKVLTFNNGSEISAKAIIISTGADPKKLNVDGEEKFRGKGVSYCATCDGAFFQNKRVAVIGGGNSAVMEAIFLTRFAEEVFIVHRRDKLRATKINQEKAFSERKINFIWDSVVEKIEGTDTVTGIRLKNLKSGVSESLHIDGVFIYIGSSPNTEFIHGLVELDNNGFIITDEKWPLRYLVYMPPEMSDQKASDR